MSVNPFFNHITAKNEQDFFEDLIIESIQVGGHDMYYIPRDYDLLDPILGETFQNSFNNYRKIEVFIENPEGYGGQGDIMTKFGLLIQDDMKLRVSRKRFEIVLGDLRERPREGDLIFIGDPEKDTDAFINSVFEITHVTNAAPFFQLGRSAMYEFYTQRFSFGQEKFDTGINSVDKLFAGISLEPDDEPEKVTPAAGNKAISDVFADLGNFDETNPFKAF